MKRIVYALCLMASITCSLARTGLADDVDGYLYQSTAQAVSTAPVFNVGQLSRLSIQVTYSSATNAAISFTSGVKSTATITVGANFALLADATAYSTIKVSSNSAGAIGGAVITINGYALKEGILWRRQDTSTGTAASLATAIQLYTALVSTASYGGTSSDTVRLSATAYGTFGNSYTITSSMPTALVLSGATFTGGLDQGYVSINGTILYAGRDFAVGSSTAATATNIAAAMNANTTLSAIVTSTAPLTCTIGACGVVRSTANAPGVNAYALSTSSYSILSPSGFRFDWGVNSNIDSASDTITKSNTLTLGGGAGLGGTAVTGLSANTTYYAIPVVLGSSFKLSNTSSGAVAGIALDISTSATGGGSFTLTPTTCTTGASFVLQQSNDLVNWVTAVSTYPLPTTTLGAPSGVSSLFYDLGFYNAKYLKFNFTPPTRGGVVLDIAIHGKR